MEYSNNKPDTACKAGKSARRYKLVIVYQVGDQDSVERVPWDPHNLTVSEDDLNNERQDIKKAYIEQGVTMIAERAFYNCTSLQSVVIPGSVTEISQRAFWNCESLQSVVIPKSVTVIGVSAFYGCEALQSVVIPGGVTSIGAKTFRDCTSLQSVVIPESVAEIGERAFYECTSLQSVVIPEGIIEIGDKAFVDCSSLRYLVCSDGLLNDLEEQVPQGCAVFSANNKMGLIAYFKEHDPLDPHGWDLLEDEGLLAEVTCQHLSLVYDALVLRIPAAHDILSERVEELPGVLRQVIRAREALPGSSSHSILADSHTKTVNDHSPGEGAS